MFVFLMEVTGAAVSQRAEAGHNKSPSFAARWGNVHFSLTLRTLLANTFGLKWSENGLLCTF